MYENDLVSESDIPDYLQSAYNVLKCAYPEGVPKNDYAALMANLHEHKSFRNLAKVLAVVSRKPYYETYNVAMGFRVGDPMYPFDQSDIDRVREKLIPCGFEKWIEEERLVFTEATEMMAINVPYADYLSGRFGKHVEWVDGNVIAMSEPTVRELNIRWFLRTLFQTYLDMTGGGKAFSDPFTMRLGDDLPARQPDDFVILPDCIHFLTEQGVAGAANLVVEVVTMGYEYVDHEIKFREYERGGVQEYWIIDPERQETLFYVLGDDGLFHSRLPVDGLYTSYVLPKLKLSVKLLLQEKPPTTLEAVRLVEQMLAE